MAVHCMSLFSRTVALTMTRYVVLLNSNVVNRYSLLTFGIIWSLSSTFTYPDDGRASERGLISTSSSHRNEFMSAVVVVVSPSFTRSEHIVPVRELFQNHTISSNTLLSERRYQQSLPIKFMFVPSRNCLQADLTHRKKLS
jgi:hypothetical protein